MSLILSNGYRQPETGDFGSSFFPDLEFNIQRVNDHTHNGTDSNKLSSSSVQGEIVAIASGDFTLVSPGIFSQRVSLPSGMSIDNVSVQLRDTVTKERVHLKIEKFSVTEIDVFTNFVDNFEALFTA